ncbi:NADPH-dependent F420 reductase [Pseudonocardia sp. ICBG1293]|uniref:NADPH-dependent F420 reductase n=1 Tax=Pseudonocardia sp. ICBG1293 TaxID=2844382 RepID=UPI001CCC17A4|nr:NAD(P)-binding domain-containing protein [Pseudonocardia sp. ICBG1293]
MRIGIIGAGQIGGTLARRLAELGHEVRVANSRAPETVPDHVTATGAKAVLAEDAAAGAELVIVSIPQKNTPDLAPGTVPTGVPVIETNNYYPQQRDGLIQAIEDGTPESVWVAGQLGTDSVYKVFNGIWWKHLLEKGVPAGTPGRIALPVAGAPGADKQTVFALVDELGFDPVDGGTLAESWRQQPGTPVYGKDHDAERATAALAGASPERTEEWRAA